MVLSAAVVLVVGTLLFTLFVRSQDVPEAPAVSPTAHLDERKAQIYENLRDLQFEFRLGKLSDADYQKTKLDLAARTGESDGGDRCGAACRAGHASCAAQPAAAKVSDKCPHCGAKFPQPLKFCGECGKAMA